VYEVTFTCPDCGRTSWNPNDAREGYCGACHAVTATQTASLSGSNSERQSVGLPGHCEPCSALGHVRAHPELGCGDVGCTSAH
jgi:hypothetical protein